MSLAIGIKQAICIKSRRRFMRKKILIPAMLLAAGVATLGFTGCGKNNTQQTSQTGSSTDQAEDDKNTPDDQETDAQGEKPGEPAVDDTVEDVEEETIVENPSRVSVHDPSVVVGKDGTYYVFGSHIAAAKSDNLINWTSFGQGYKTKGNSLYGNLSKNLAGSFQWAGRDDSDCKNGFAVWAPDVFWNEEYVNEDGSKGAYMIYYCTSSTAIRSCIGYAVSQEIEGPYTYVDTIIYSGFTKTETYDQGSDHNKCYENTNIPKLIEEGKIDGVNENWFRGNLGYDSGYAPNAIDPEIFFDTEGNMWMVYGSWSGGIYLLEMDAATGQPIYPGTSYAMEDKQESADGETDTRIVDSYFGTRIAGGYGASGEGPYIVYDAETQYYYLYVTYEYLDAFSGYNMRLFRSKTPDGPYLDAKGHNAALPSNIGHNDYGIKVMGNYRFSTMTNMKGGYRSCGHNSALVDEDGSRYLFYHTRFELNPNPHEVRVHQQFINSQGWPVTAVYEYKGDKISKTGYNVSKIVGDYEFINHGIQCDREDMLEVKNITLNEDRTITGDITGTWEKTNGNYLAEFDIEEAHYSGVFFEQHDESDDCNDVMTFTAIGDNNMTIWGVKKLDGAESEDETGSEEETESEDETEGEDNSEDEE